MTNIFKGPLAFRPKETGGEKKMKLNISLLGFGFLVLATIVTFRGITIHHDVTLKTELYSPVRIDLNR